MAMHGDSETARRSAAEASTEAASAKREVGQLEDELARLRLVTAAVWELVRERAKLTENDLLAKVAEIDGRDGVIDGKLVRPVRKCGQCGRTMPARQGKCMYCGTVFVASSAFEGI